MSRTDGDPLDDADIGETKRLESETQFSFWGGEEAEPYLGFDREHSDLSIESAEVLGERGEEEVRIVYSANVTKQEAPEQTTSNDVDIDRPHWIRWFKTPLSATIIFAGLSILSPGNAFELLPVWLLVIVAWMAWSITSGAYPWSMGMGGFR